MSLSCGPEGFCDCSSDVISCTSTTPSFDISFAKDHHLIIDMQNLEFDIDIDSLRMYKSVMITNAPASMCDKEMLRKVAHIPECMEAKLQDRTPTSFNALVTVRVEVEDNLKWYLFVMVVMLAVLVIITMFLTCSLLVGYFNLHLQMSRIIRIRLRETLALRTLFCLTEPLFQCARKCCHCFTICANAKSPYQKGIFYSPST